MPQKLVVPDDYHKVPTDYLSLLKTAVESGKPLLIIDEPQQEMSAAEMEQIDPAVKKERNRVLSEVAAEESLRFMESLKGTTQKVLIEEKDLPEGEDKLAEAVLALASDKERLSAMSEAAKKLARPDAADIIYKELGLDA